MLVDGGSVTELSRSEAQRPPVTALCIYRARNAAEVERLLLDVMPTATDVRLWALDEVAPTLAGRTVGCGPGGKFPLLNRLVAAAHLPVDRYLAVLDDDVRFVRGDLGVLLDRAIAADLQLVQPAHARRSHSSHPITRRRPLSCVRLTTFVEIGPVFLVAPPARERIVPFPEDEGMGWGLELRWSALRSDGMRLGIVDDVSVRHLTPPTDSYDATDERKRVAKLLAAMGVTSMRDLQSTLATWRRWQPRPPWR